MSVCGARLIGESLAVQAVQQDPSSKPKKAPWLEVASLGPRSRCCVGVKHAQSAMNRTAWELVLQPKLKETEKPQGKASKTYKDSGKTHSKSTAYMFDSPSRHNLIPTQEPPVVEEPPSKKAKRVPWQ